MQEGQKGNTPPSPERGGLGELTRALEDARLGGPAEAERLAALLYEELRGIARREMAAERNDHTLQPTALVHEAYLRLVGSNGDGFADRTQFLSAGAVAVRRVLVEHARKRARLKRGGDRARVDLAKLELADEERDEAVLALDEALQKLEAFSPEHARTVELRFFAGMTVDEIAVFRGVSPSTVQREWRFARAWLHGELEER